MLSIAFLFFPVIIFSANGSLSNSQAKKLIIKKYHYPQTQNFKLQKYYIEPHNGQIPKGYTGETINDNNNNDLLHRLQRIGVITIGSKEGYQPTGTSYKIFTVDLTKEGEKYLIKESNDIYIVKTCDISFIKVVSIKKQDHTTKVDYTVKIENISPFGLNITNTIIKKEITCKLFEGGWRIIQ